MPYWRFDNNAEQRLKSLLEIISPTTQEVPIANYLRSCWSKLSTNISTDVLGNVYSTLEGATPIHIGLVAHIDTVAIQITKVHSNGLIQFRTIGLSAHVLLGQQVCILSEDSIVEGVIGFDPTSQYGQPKGLINDDLWIDIGQASKEDTLNLINIGDFAVLKPKCSKLGESCISATGIDNSIGVFIISECLRWFSENGSPVCLHTIGSVQEEIGLRGASAISHHKQLNACIVVDVDYATDTLTSHENQLGQLYLGTGVGLHKKADNNPILQRLFIDVANEHNIAYQINLGRHIYGGTDATSLQLQMGGVATININIPCRYMHSAIETCHKSDVESAVNLLITSINRIAELNKSSFIPGID